MKFIAENKGNLGFKGNIGHYRSKNEMESTLSSLPLIAEVERGKRKIGSIGTLQIGTDQLNLYEPNTHNKFFKRVSGYVIDDKQKIRIAVIKTRVLAWILIVGLVLGSGGLIYWSITRNQTIQVMEENGPLDISDTSTEEALKAAMDESKIAVSINAHPYFASGTSEGNLQIENMAVNNKYLKIEIYLDATGEKIYDTKKLLPPNSNIKNDKLDVELARGSYQATAYFIAYKMDDPSQETGRAAVQITITVD